MTSNGPAVTLHEAGVRYGNGTLALDGVSLQVAAGEFVAVVGPSGGGKSTLLRLAAGLLAPSGGTVERTADRLGFVFQDPTLLPWRSVRGNVELAGELRGVRRAERRRLAEESLARVGLSEVARQLPRTLSGGMRMRVSLARTLTGRPELMLFDEPFGSVDEITRERLGEQLQELFVADGFAGLLVTHSVAEAVFLAQRVVVLSDRPGRVVGEVAVPLPYPREPQVRFSPAFTELTARVSALLRGGNPPPEPAATCAEAKTAASAEPKNPPSAEPKTAEPTNAPSAEAKTAEVKTADAKPGAAKSVAAGKEVP
ncbi:ATP-binding cassette domain-containing protein [Catellatospora sp. NPDC049609]|uniref:ABC transporter ATP-binding protein n=1 Tax=Catellatospora sp. NPDC049609 TaxID=3155505 RepID=UPI00343A7B27